MNDSSTEFVSDSLAASSQDLEEVRENMRKLGIDTTSANGKTGDRPSSHVLFFTFLRISAHTFHQYIFLFFVWSLPS